MFSETIDFENCREECKKIDYLYEIFKRDFIYEKVYLNGTIYIDPKIHDKHDGKENIFWHIITRKERGQRQFDPFRAYRIKWIKPMIVNCFDAKIKNFYYYENSSKIRFYLWAYEHDFVVILQKLGNTSSYLVTSFFIDNQRKRDIFQRKFENYKNGIDNRLRGCEWF